MSMLFTSKDITILIAPFIVYFTKQRQHFNAHFATDLAMNMSGNKNNATKEFSTNKTFKAVQYLLAARELNKAQYDIKDIHFSDKNRNIAVSAGIYVAYRYKLRL